MFRFAQHDRKTDERKFLNAVSTQLDLSDRWGSAYRRLIVGLLTGGFFLRLVQRFLDFDGLFWRFPLFSRLRFQLFPWSFCRLFGQSPWFCVRRFQRSLLFFVQQFGRLLWFSCLRFQVRLDCLACFLCSVLYVFYCAFLAKGGESRGVTTAIVRIDIFMTASFSLLSLYKENGCSEPGTCIVPRRRGEVSREVRATSLAAHTFVNQREFFQWMPKT